MASKGCPELAFSIASIDSVRMVANDNDPIVCDIFSNINSLVPSVIKGR
jgi:hypothetical protein